MGLRMGSDDTYKFHPPVPSERPRSRLRSTLRRKRAAKEDMNHGVKSPEAVYKGLMFHVRADTTSAQNTEHNSVQATPRVSLSARPASQASLTPSIACRTEEEPSKKWWSGRSRKVKHSTSKHSFQSSGQTSRRPSTELLGTIGRPADRQSDGSTPGISDCVLAVRSELI